MSYYKPRNTFLGKLNGNIRYIVGEMTPNLNSDQLAKLLKRSEFGLEGRDN
jgi:hypothetical protein